MITLQKHYKLLKSNKSNDFLLLGPDTVQDTPINNSEVEEERNMKREKRLKRRKQVFISFRVSSFQTLALF
jgi:hypothetical protein